MILTLLEKIVVGAIALGLSVLIFGSAFAAVPPQGSAPQDEAPSEESSVYWVLFVRGPATQDRLAPAVYVDEDLCRAIEEKAAADPRIFETSGCIRIEMKSKGLVPNKESAK